MIKLVIASNNKGKIREYRQLLEPLGYDAVSQSEAGIHLEAEETGNTFAENAAIKARAIKDLAEGCAVLADDSGLAVDALGGEPGIYSARYGGLDTDEERTALLLKNLEGVEDSRRTAHFVCCIHFIRENGEEIMAEGKVSGHIGHEPVGENGFGYDPVFMYEGRSFAQHSAEFKNKVSHRAKALENLMEQLEKI